MLVVVLGAVACLLCWRNNILIRRQIDECLAAISASDNDIHAQCWGRRRRRGRLAYIRRRVSQGRNRVLLSSHYLVHGHCGQHIQPDCRTRRLYPLDCFTEQLVGLPVTQSITEKRRWRLSFTSFYPVIHRWLRTRTIRWHSTLPTYHVA